MRHMTLRDKAPMLFCTRPCLIFEKGYSDRLGFILRDPYVLYCPAFWAKKIRLVLSHDGIFPPATGDHFVIFLHFDTA